MLNISSFCEDPDNMVRIYAFIVARKIVYVGQTWSVSHRLRCHVNQKLGPIHKAKSMGDLSVRVLRKTIPLHALRIERQIIKALKSRGQCQINHWMNACDAKRERKGSDQIKLIHCESGLIFNSIAAASREHNMSPATVKNRIKQGVFQYAK